MEGMDDFIQIFVTGGTFDKEYDYLKGRLYFRNTHVPEMLERARCRLPIDVKMLMMVDSLEMTEEDRAIIVHNCKRVSTNRIVITHGTDTMVETAKTLARADIEGKTIVITGALVPYAFHSSDGFFNLGNALAFVQTLAPGVYIAMHGIAFKWNEVRKNPKTGFFEKIEPADVYPGASSN